MRGKHLTALATAIPVALFLFVPSAAQAQAQRVARISTAAPIAQTRNGSAGGFVVRAGNVRQMGSQRVLIPAGTSLGTFSNTSGFTGTPPFVFPTSSFGFDSGFNRDLGIEAAIDPATQFRLALVERLLRDTRHFRRSGVFLIDGGGSYVAPQEPAQQPQPQIIVLQQPAPTEQSAPAAQPPAESAPVASEPLRDEGQFTLVLRSGTQVEALAFTHMKDKIVYITTDGGRRTIAAADLDSDATMRVNEERGVPLQLPL